MNILKLLYQKLYTVFVEKIDMKAKPKKHIEIDEDVNYDSTIKVNPPVYAFPPVVVTPVESSDSSFGDSGGGW